ncbi:MAG: LysR family transcriptional regulator, partial [Hyphomicrobiaceae bacterium]
MQLMGRSTLPRRTKKILQADIRLLRVFQTIVQSGGIAAAELSLNVGRSTISRQLSDLELRLGMKLCDRGPGGFALTEEGAQVFDAANRLLVSVDDFAVEVNELCNKLVGRLFVGLFDMTLSNPKAQVISAFRKFDAIAPDVRLRLRMLGTDATEKGVLNGELHVGIVPSQRKSGSLDYHQLYSEQMYLYCGAAHSFFPRNDKAISPREIRAARYAGLEYHSPNMVVSRREQLNRHALVNDQEALAILIRSGRYIGFLPEHFARPYVEREVLRPIRSDRYRYNTEFFAIVKKNPKPA